MTIEQFMALLQHIRAEHTQVYASTKRIVKYIYPAIDMRDNTIFSVRIREWFCREPKTFQIPSAIEPPEGPLYDRIMVWLDEVAR